MIFRVIDVLAEGGSQFTNGGLKPFRFSGEKKASADLSDFLVCWQEGTREPFYPGFRFLSCRIGCLEEEFPFMVQAERPERNSLLSRRSPRAYLSAVLLFNATRRFFFSLFGFRGWHLQDRGNAKVGEPFKTASQRSP